MVLTKSTPLTPGVVQMRTGASNTQLALLQMGSGAHKGPAFIQQVATIASHRFGVRREGGGRWRSAMVKKQGYASTSRAQ